MDATVDNVDDGTSDYLIWYGVLAAGTAIELKLTLNTIFSSINDENDKDGW